MSRLLESWARFLPHSGCRGCDRRRAAIVKMARSVAGTARRAAVMFSGGLDSTYAAYSARQAGYDVALYHVRWLYENSRINEAELKAAKDVAQWLQLPLHIIGEVWVSKEHVGSVMRIPAIGSMLVCHRSLTFDYLVTGLAPSISERDNSWNRLLCSMRDSCMPDMKIWHPRDGILRSRIEIPDELRKLVFSRVQKTDAE